MGHRGQVGVLSIVQDRQLPAAVMFILRRHVVRGFVIGTLHGRLPGGDNPLLAGVHDQPLTQAREEHLLLGLVVLIHRQCDVLIVGGQLGQRIPTYLSLDQM